MQLILRLWVEVLHTALMVQAGKLHMHQRAALLAYEGRLARSDAIDC